MEQYPEKKEEKFIPYGAIVCFILFVLLGVAIWFTVYSIMLRRI
ncbi:hypothetical protein [Thermoflavifilum sp.]|jgi:hypothetical protein|nr:hypothetical protein [Thermoflavifilum sp.]